MGRFTHLEWTDPKGAGKGSAPGPAERARAASGQGGGDGVDPGPRDEAHWLKEAQAAARTGRFEKALRMYSRALEMDPNMAAGWIGQVRMLLDLGELREAAVWADKGLDIHRDHPELLAAKAQAVARQGDPIRALALNDAAMKGKGAPPAVWISRGEALLATERGGEEHAFEKAKVESKGDPAVSVAVARIYLGYGHPALAHAWAEAAARKETGYAFAWRVAGEAELLLGMADQARRSLANARSLDPDCPGAADLLARLDEESILTTLGRRLSALFSRKGTRRA